MADKPAVGLTDAAQDAVPVSQPKPARNPVLQMLGLPNTRFKLPSRNWLIFLSVTGSFTTAILYDRYHKRKAQQRWCNLVSHIAQEPLPATTMPRRITIFLSAPPGDSLRAARDHFHEYVKPVLVAGAMDWDVVEGRREGDVRAGLAEKIRMRRRKAERPPVRDAEDDTEEKAKAGLAEEAEDLVQNLRDTAGVKEWEGVQGDLVLGRNTWKEYVRGLHEGWLGPLLPPPEPLPEPATSTDTPVSITQQSSFADDATPKTDQTTAASDQQPPDQKDVAKEKEKSKQPIQIPSYISPSDYSSAPLPQSVPEALPPSAVVPFPHLLGFFNTPIRIYRFLNRRYLADETGREVAALVLASYIRACNANLENASNPDPDTTPSTSNTAPPPADVVSIQKRWEQEGVLQGEERDWHKSAWQPRVGDEERVWKDPMVIDTRVGNRMRRFELGADDEERAKRDEGVDAAAKGAWDSVKELMGWESDTSVKGWEHGLIGDESG